MIRLLFLGIVLALSTVANGQVFRSYQVGNSLTVTATPSGALANWRLADSGEILLGGYHIRCGQPLYLTYEGPELETCASPPYRGTWSVALLNYSDWDAVVFQPHPGIGSTLETDLLSISGWINSTESETFYIMQGYPTQTNFANKWNAAVVDSLNTPTTHASQYYQHLIARVRAANPEVDIYLIPVGEALGLIEQRLAANPITIDGLVLDSAEDLYRDPIHGNRYGGFASGISIYASMFQTEVSGLNSSNSGLKYGEETIWSPELYDVIHRAVYDAHRQTPFARQLVSVPGDIDRDGNVSFLDISPFINVLVNGGVQEEADINQDGSVNFLDISGFIGVLN